MGSRLSWVSFVVRLAGALALRPRLWPVIYRFRRIGWTRHFPYLPVPTLAYLHFRLETAYGETSGPPPLEDVLRFLQWAHDFPR